MTSPSNFSPSSFRPPPTTPHPHYISQQYAPPQYVAYPQHISSVAYSPYGIPPQQGMLPPGYGAHPGYYLPSHHQALHPSSATPSELSMYQSLSLQRKRAREPEVTPPNKRRKADQLRIEPAVEGAVPVRTLPQEQRPVISVTNPTPPPPPHFTRNSVIYSPCFCCLTDVRFYATLCNELKRIATELDRPANEKVRSSVWNYFYWITGEKKTTSPNSLIKPMLEQWLMSDRIDVSMIEYLYLSVLCLPIRKEFFQPKC